MKKIIIIVTIMIIIIGGAFTATFLYVKQLNPVQFNGQLKVKDGQLKNRFGQTVQLRGLSSHGIQWEDGKLINYDNLKILRDEWNVNVFRVAMYTEEGGYISNKEEIKEKAFKIMDDCIDLGLYVVIDWHILSDNSPQIHKNDAKEFFNEVSTKYKDVPNVLYEICNEPNGEETSWNGDIVPYAKEMIDTIRSNSEKALVIVGTTGWSRNILTALNSQLQYNNILYAFHFYSGSHGEVYRVHIDYAIEKKLPIFVSEWGTSTAEDAKEFYEEESKKWTDFLDDKKISWINWSFSNVDEATSIIKKDATEIKDENLTESGKFIKSILQRNKK